MLADIGRNNCCLYRHSQAADINIFQLHNAQVKDLNSAYIGKQYLSRFF